MTCAPPFAHSAGPRDAKIALVGEAWGRDEELVGGKPFIGASGQELTRMLRDVGIRRSDCFMTNVLALRPPDNKIEALCVKKTALPPDYLEPPLSQGSYLRPEYLPEVERLRAELDKVAPNVIVALGGTATWALLGHGRIGTVRGVVATHGSRVAGRKVIPTYHPAGVLRNWAWRPVVLADLLKASRESAFPEIRRPKRRVLVDPTLAEIAVWTQSLIFDRPPVAIAVDIETTAGQIDCIGFAVSPVDAMVIPFGDARYPGASYWRDDLSECAAWGQVRRIMESPIPKIFQNGLYDLQYIPKLLIRCRACDEDTMLLHHALYPELQKGLGFLGSIYTNESSWKLLRKRGEDQLKRDDE